MPELDTKEHGDGHIPRLLSAASWRPGSHRADFTWVELSHDGKMIAGATAGVGKPFGTTIK